MNLEWQLVVFYRISWGGNNGNEVFVVVEGKQLKCGGVGGGGKTIEMWWRWWWWKKTIPMFSQKCQQFRLEHPFPSMIAGRKTAWVRSLLQQASETIYPPLKRIV